ncbi:hypothetical protein Tco_1500275 [Tanacetum coccineum]
MLHGPCGKGAASTVEGKCSKKFPKPFYSETNLDEDGYLVYRRRDSKVQAVKGPDHATFVIHENVQKPAHGEPEKVAAVDEIKNYLNCRYLAPCEAVLWLFSFDINYSYPSVMKLNFHLEDQQAITLRDSGPRGFKELMTVNKKLYPTFKAACFAYGMLNDDKEWAHAIKEAAFWALAPQLCDLFVTTLLFCDVSRPLHLWEQTWELLSGDILRKK